MTVSLAASVAIFSAGCSDLGSCDKPDRGRSTVVAGNQLMYTGQAILTQACAQGCHSSSAKGTARYGAPADLNFDLLPLTPGPVVKDNAGNVVGVQVDAAALAGLRSRQRKVYDQRENIWDQIEKGLMPPSKYSGFESLVTIVRAAFGMDGKCTRSTALTTLDDHKEELRLWLACSTPVVEASSDQLPYKPFAATDKVSDRAAGSGYYATTQSVGYQYPACGSTGGGGGDAGTGAPSFSEVYTTAFLACKACHVKGGLNTAIDFSTEDTAYAGLLGTGAGKPQVTGCAMNASPYVTPNDPAKSYVLAKMDKSGTSGAHCGDVMPPGAGADSASIQLVKSWIAGGALRMPASGGAASAGDAGTDAGR